MKGAAQEDNSVLAAPVSPDEWAASYRSIIDALPTETAAVIVTQTPIMHTDVPPCLSSHVNEARSCGTDASIALADPFDTAEKAVDASTRAVLLELDDRFCRDGFCGAVDGATLIYRDSHHITDEFAQSLSPEFRDVFVSLGIIPA